MQTVVGIILLLHVLCKCMINFSLLTLAIFPFPCIYINKGDEKEMGVFLSIYWIRFPNKLPTFNIINALKQQGSGSRSMFPGSLGTYQK